MRLAWKVGCFIVGVQVQILPSALWEKIMAKYVRNFKKVVYGYVEVKADSPEEAQKKFDNGKEDEFDNKSEYEWEEWEKG